MEFGNRSSFQSIYPFNGHLPIELQKALIYISQNIDRSNLWLCNNSQELSQILQAICFLNMGVPPKFTKIILSSNKIIKFQL